jgi:uncharacterized protein (DUF934 family)
MNRQEVFEIINTERNYQDNLWPPHNGHKNSEHCLVSLQAYLRKAEDAWITSSNNGIGVWQQLAKMAAIIVRALESSDETIELKKGLR